MATRGSSSRWLALTGLGVVLGLGLLFQVSASGQQPAPVDPKDRRDQEIEALKRAIKALEEQKKADTAAQYQRALGYGAAPAGGGAPADLPGQLKELEAQIAKQRAELQALEAKAQELRAKIKAGEAARVYGAPGVTPPPGTTDRRVDDLEKKMDLLQKELEGLRRELRRGRVNPPAGSGGGTAPAYPGDNPFGGTGPLVPPQPATTTAPPAPRDNTPVAPGRTTPPGSGPPPAVTAPRGS
jgi:hypothetical protein